MGLRPQVPEPFVEVLRDYTAGDPMNPDVRWTNLSRRQIARRIKDRGTSVGAWERRPLYRRNRDPRSNPFPRPRAASNASAHQSERTSPPAGVTAPQNIDGATDGEIVLTDPSARALIIPLRCGVWAKFSSHASCHGIGMTWKVSDVTADHIPCVTGGEPEVAG